MLDGAAPPGKQRPPQERSDHMEKEKRSCKEARLRREPRVNVPRRATKAACFSSSVTATIAKTFQPFHRARRLLHLPRRIRHTNQFDGYDVASNGQDVTRIGDPVFDLIVLGVSLFHSIRTHRVSGLPCLMSSCLPISEIFEIQTVSRVFMDGCGFLIIAQSAQNIQNRQKATLLLLLLVGCKQALLHGRSSLPRLLR